MCLSVFGMGSLTVCLSVCLSLCLSVTVCVSFCLRNGLCLSVCLSVCLSLCVFLSSRWSLSLSVCPSVCLSLAMSLCHCLCVFLYSRWVIMNTEIKVPSAENQELPKIFILSLEEVRTAQCMLHLLPGTLPCWFTRFKS